MALFPEKFPKLWFKREVRVLFPPSHSSAGDRPHRVVVTGAGIITALGAGWRVNAEGFRAGRPAFRPVTLFDVSRQRAKIAAEIDLPSGLPSTQLSANAARRLDRATRMLLHAAHEAWTQAGWEPSENLPVVLGTTSGEMALGEKYLQQALAIAVRKAAATHAHRALPGAAARNQSLQRLWFSRPAHDHFQRVRLRGKCHRPRLGNVAARARGQSVDGWL